MKVATILGVLVSLGLAGCGSAVSREAAQPSAADAASRTASNGLEKTDKKLKRTVAIASNSDDLDDQIYSLVANDSFDSYQLQVRAGGDGQISATYPIDNATQIGGKGKAVVTTYDDSVTTYQLDPGALKQVRTWKVKIPGQEGSASAGPVSILANGQILVGVLVGDPPLTANWYGLALYTPVGKLLSIFEFPEKVPDYFFAATGIDTAFDGATFVVALQCQGGLCGGPGVVNGFLYELTAGSGSLRFVKRWASPLFIDTTGLGALNQREVLIVPPLSAADGSDAEVSSGSNRQQYQTANGSLRVKPRLTPAPVSEIDLTSSPVVVAALPTAQPPVGLAVPQVAPPGGSISSSKPASNSNVAYGSAYVLTSSIKDSGSRLIQPFTASGPQWKPVGEPWIASWPE